MRDPSLLIDAGMGIAGDMFSAALIGLGAPKTGAMEAMRVAGNLIGKTDVSCSQKILPDGLQAVQMNINFDTHKTLSIAEAPGILERALRLTGVRGSYAGFAHRALAILSVAERAAHEILSNETSETPSVTATVIGHAHTPYKNQAPYQPKKEQDSSDEVFYIELYTPFTEALDKLDSFSHLFVLSYLERSPGYSMLVCPPWKKAPSRYGVLATRSPNRPSPIGLTRVRLHRIEKSRIYTGPLDLFDGTPVLDIKPYIKSLDGPPDDYRSEKEMGNDGWLENSEHIEMHRLGIPHEHVGGGQLHEAQDIVLDLVGAAWSLQSLDVDLKTIDCMNPVRVGGGTTPKTSHGRLPVPAPATQAILDEYDIPYRTGPEEAELLTPTGAAILAALSPSYVDRGPEGPEYLETISVGAGMGQRVFPSLAPNLLRLFRKLG